MTTTAAAIYENGVLRPLVPLPFPEGTRVEMTVMDVDGESVASTDNRALIDSLREIADLPMESNLGPFSGQNHDHALYGGKTTKP